MKVNDKYVEALVEYMSKHCVGINGTMPCYEKSKAVNQNWCKHGLTGKKTCKERLWKKLKEED